MREKAHLVGQSIKQEHGVETAAQFIYVNLERSKRTPRPLKKDRRSSSHAEEAISSEEEDSEEEKAEDLQDKRRSKSTSFTDSLRFNSIKRAVSRPKNSLTGKGGRGRTANAVTSKERVQSPDQMHFISSDEEHKDSKSRSKSNWHSLQHSLTFQRPSNMPHMSMPGLLKMGFGNDGKADDEDPTEEEKQEEKERHTSAKEEDAKRREALVQIWKKAGRLGLLRESEKDDETAQKEDGEVEM